MTKRKWPSWQKKKRKLLQLGHVFWIKECRHYILEDDEQRFWKNDRSGPGSLCRWHDNQKQQSRTTHPIIVRANQSITLILHHLDLLGRMETGNLVVKIWFEISNETSTQGPMSGRFHSWNDTYQRWEKARGTTSDFVCWSIILWDTLQNRNFVRIPTWICAWKSINNRIPTHKQPNKVRGVPCRYGNNGWHGGPSAKSV